MARNRLIIRHTQKEIDARKVELRSVSDMTREELQAAAKAKGIDARQSSDALREALK